MSRFDRFREIGKWTLFVVLGALIQPMAADIYVFVKSRFLGLDLVNVLYSLYDLIKLPEAWSSVYFVVVAGYLYKRSFHGYFSTTYENTKRIFSLDYDSRVTFAPLILLLSAPIFPTWIFHQAILSFGFGEPGSSQLHWILGIILMVSAFTIPFELTSHLRWSREGEKK